MGSAARKPDPRSSLRSALRTKRSSRRPTSGENIVRDLRREIGLSQAELAKRLGVHPMTVSKWERDVAKPSPTVILALEKLRDQRGSTSI